MSENKTCRFRDPIYGFIDNINKEELRIIDSPLFQRLRRIHQLALTKYIYPSAEHSRFVHSLGVMHCATQMYKAINKCKQDDNELQTLRFAALLHDIGHLPFSHASEKVVLDKIKHEDLSIFIIKNDSCIRNAIEDAGCKPNDVASLLSKKMRLQKFDLISKLISGDLDADRADYLLRDSYCCGINYGNYDFARYKNIFSYEDGELTIQEKDIFLAESMLMARYHYNLQVIYHRTRAGYDIVLQKFLESSPKIMYNISESGEKLSNADSLNLDEFEFFDDYTVFEQAKLDYRGKTNEWAAYFLRFEHLLPILDVTFQVKEDEELLKLCEFELEKHKKLKYNHDYFIKSVSANIIDDNNDIMVKLKYGKQRRLTEYSPIFNKLIEKPFKFGRIYARKEKETELKKIFEKCKKYINSKQEANI